MRQLQWKKSQVTATTETGVFRGRKAVITVPIGVLQTEGILFSPSLPQVTEIAQRLGFGHVVKILFGCQTAFWKQQQVTGGKDLGDLGFLFSEEEIPTWWTHYPAGDNMLTGWLGGPRANQLQSLTGDEIRLKAIKALSKILHLDLEMLRQKLQEIWHYNWSADPHFCGAYSYEVVGGVELILQLQQPVEETLYFCGEGLHSGPQIGTVEAALQSAQHTVQQVKNHFSL